MAEDNNSPKEEEEESEEQEDDLSIPSEIMEGIPPEIQNKVRRAYSMSLSMARGIMPIQHPLTNKVTSGHIDKVLDNIENEDIRQANDRKSTRRHLFWGAVFVVLVFVGLIVFFQLTDNKEMQMNVLIGALALLGGLGGGFGIGRYSST